MKSSGFDRAELKNNDVSIALITTANDLRQAILWSGVSVTKFGTLTVTLELANGSPASSGSVCDRRNLPQRLSPPHTSTWNRSSPPAVVPFESQPRWNQTNKGAMEMDMHRTHAVAMPGRMAGLAAEGSAPAGLQALARGDEVNDDPVAGSDSAREVTPGADPLNSDKTGVSLMGGLNVARAAFDPGAAGADQQARSVARRRFARARRQHRKLRAMLAILGATVGGSAFAPSAQATVVDSVKVSNTADSGKGSLRAAIDAANSEPTGSIGRIVFDLPTIGGKVPGAPTTVPVIRPTSDLPTLTKSVIIDGYTQPGSAPRTATSAANNLVVIAAGGLSRGLELDTNNSRISGLVITGADGPGIELNGDQNTITGSYIGVTNDGAAAANADDGI